MESVFSVVGLIAAALCFGGMVFFAAVTAPHVFIVLDEENAGKLIRAIFPWYYLFVIVTGGIGALMYLTVLPYAAAGLGIAALGALISRQGLMPRINGARDQAKDGDEEAEARFNKLHTVSVRINGVGLIGTLVAIVQIALNQ